MVDCGGLLGGRLGNNINMHAASLKKAKVGTLSACLMCPPSCCMSIALALNVPGPSMAGISPLHHSLLSCPSAALGGSTAVNRSPGRASDMVVIVQAGANYYPQTYDKAGKCVTANRGSAALKPAYSSIL